MYLDSNQMKERSRNAATIENLEICLTVNQLKYSSGRSMSRIPLPSPPQPHSRTNNSASNSLAFPPNAVDRAPSPLGFSSNRHINQSSPSVSMSSNLSGQHGSMSETRRKQSKRDEVGVCMF